MTRSEEIEHHRRQEMEEARKQAMKLMNIEEARGQGRMAKILKRELKEVITMSDYGEENKRVALVFEQTKEFLEVCGSYKPGYGERNRKGIESVEFARVIKASMDLTRALSDLNKPIK